MNVEGKVALVTGASRGIGRASVLALAKMGAAVAVGFHRDSAGASETATLASAAEPIAIDVTDPSSIDSAFEKVERSLGQVNILVNNAGATRDQLFMRMAEEDWTDILDVNLTGSYRCTKRALPQMLDARWGRIINITSVVALTGNAGQTNYTAAKAGLIGFTKSLSREVARRGITVNAIAPGFVQTALTSAMSEKAKEAILAKITLGRMGEAQEIAQAVEFLAQASYVTGQVVVVDGGLT